jgi:hypothetical protein
MNILPRLDRGFATALVSELQGLSPSEARERAREGADELEFHIRYTEVGGQQLALKELVGLCAHLREQAGTLGYPLVPCATSDGRAFDLGVARALGAFLGQHDVPVGEAGRDGFWLLLACGLLPDLVIWRWSSNPGGEWKSVTEARYTSFNRGAFSLPWWWTRVFREAGGDEPVWSVLDELTSDNVVAVVERPSIAGQPGLGLAIAGAHRRHMQPFARTGLRRPKKDGSGKDESIGHESLLRDVMKRVIRFGGFIEWSLLTLAEREALVEEVFVAARVALGDVEAGARSIPSTPPAMAAEVDVPAQALQQPPPGTPRPSLAEIRIDPDELHRHGLPSPSDAALFALKFIGTRTAQDLVSLDPGTDEFRALPVQQQMAVRRFASEFRKAWGD